MAGEREVAFALGRIIDVQSQAFKVLDFTDSIAADGGAFEFNRNGSISAGSSAETRITVGSISGSDVMFEINTLCSTESAVSIGEGSDGTVSDQHALFNRNRNSAGPIPAVTAYTYAPVTYQGDIILSGAGVPAEESFKFRFQLKQAEEYMVRISNVSGVQCSFELRGCFYVFVPGKVIYIVK